MCQHTREVRKAKLRPFQLVQTNTNKYPNNSVGSLPGDPGADAVNYENPTKPPNESIQTFDEEKKHATLKSTSEFVEGNEVP